MKIFDNFNPVLRDIKQYFDFLFEKGYKIRFSNFRSKSVLIWEVVLESPQCLLHLYQERNDVFLTFAPVDAIGPNNEIRVKDQIAIEFAIFYLSKGGIFVHLFGDDLSNAFLRDRKIQFEALANLLKKYIDQITPYFGNNEFRLHQSNMLAAKKEYNKLLMRKYGN